MIASLIKLVLKFNPILWVFITAGVMWMDYNEWETEKYLPLLAAIQTEKAVLQGLEAKLGAIEEFRAQRDQKLAEMADLREKLIEARAEFPSKSELPALLKSLADISERIGMEFSSFRPVGTEDAKEGLMAAKINVELKGSYVQVMSFLDSVSNLKRIVNTENVNLRPANEDQSSNFKSVEAEMEILTYFGGGA